MTARGFYTLLFGVLMLLTALSTGSAGAFLLGTAALLALLLALLCVLFAFLTLRIRQESDAGEVARGGRCRYVLTVRQFSPLPVAPLSLRLLLPSGRQSDFYLETRLLGQTVSENRFLCPHVGVFPVGVKSVRVSDCFALLSFSRSIRNPAAEVTVLPNPIKTPPLAFSPGSGESSAIERAQSDPTTPTDTRLWQEGDELKRVHWKLSMRRQQLIVHTYEQNQRPDALVLMDCAQPDTPPSHRALVIDTLTECCAGVVEALLDAGHAVRMPLSSAATREIGGIGSEALTAMRRELALESFSAPPEFSRVLTLSSRRMHRTGSTAILTTRLTPRIADDIIALSRMGPRTYLYFVTAATLSAEQEKLLHLLMLSGVQAQHVPAASA
ncbi:MAG: DUF58 domain-containing protein [Clostridia bacterium]|nr:DUF58 domain-containing protein [Clostridia bacterium]